MNMSDSALHNDWEIRTVDSLGSVRGGKRLPKGRSLVAVPTPYPYVRVTDMREGGVDLSKIHYVPEDVAPTIRSYRIFKDDLFISVAGTLGIVGRIPAELDGANLTENADRITAISCDINYLMYSLLSEPIQREIDAIRTVGAQPKLALGRIKQFEIRMPKDREMQRRVSTALREVDELIYSIDRLITKKQAIKQGMMQELLTGRTRLPGFTRNWVSGTFEDLASPVKERILPALVSPDTPLVELEQIEPATGRLLARSTVTTATSLKTRFSVGDVLFGKLRAYLRKFWIADTSGLCTTEIWAFRSKPAVSGEFVRFVVETDGFIEVASGAYGTHMPRSDWQTVRRYELLIPELEEQKAIASVLMDADCEIELLRARLAKARDIKQGMMQELLTGRTRLPIQEAVA